MSVNVRDVKYITDLLVGTYLDYETLAGNLRYIERILNDQIST